MKKKQVGGNKDEPKLTKKQQELVQNQIQKETATRTRLKEVSKFSIRSSVSNCYLNHLQLGKLQ